MKQSWLFPCFFLLALGCTNPFGVRSPETPSGDLPVQSNLQTSPDSILTKMRVAFATRNSQFYIECFSDSGCRYTPTQDEASRLGGWERQGEEEYFKRLVFEARQVTLRDTVISSRLLSPELYETQFRYLIIAEFQTVRERYRGQSVLRLRQESDGLWYIREWEDLTLGADDPDSSWSTLRANYR